MGNIVKIMSQQIKLGIDKEKQRQIKIPVDKKRFIPQPQKSVIIGKGLYAIIRKH
jgi:hypothetical protein